MYEELIKALQLHCEAGKKIGLNGAIWTLLDDATTAIKSLTGQLIALQAENAELREENGCLQHNVAAIQATLDQQAKNCEVLLAEKDKEIKAYEIIMKTMPAQRDEAIYRIKAAEATLARVEAERDALLEYANAQMECETCKHDVFCPLANPMQENCALCELKPKCPCHPCKWEWRGAQEEG